MYAFLTWVSYWFEEPWPEYGLLHHPFDFRWKKVTQTLRLYRKQHCSGPHNKQAHASVYKFTSTRKLSFYTWLHVFFANLIPLMVMRNDRTWCYYRRKRTEQKYIAWWTSWKFYLMSSSFKDSFVPRASRSGIMSCFSLDSAKEMDSMCWNKEKTGKPN